MDLNSSNEVEMEKRFLETYDLYADSLFRLAFIKTSNREVAKDLVQEAFSKTWENLQKTEIENLKAFIFRVLINLIIDHWKKKKSVVESDLPEGVFEDIEDESITKDAEKGELIRKLSELPDEAKNLLIMRYVEDMEVKEIAQILKEKQNTITVRLRRATEMLRKKYKQ